MGKCSIISFAYFKMPAEAATEDNLEMILALDGVEDVNANNLILKCNDISSDFTTLESGVPRLLHLQEPSSYFLQDMYED